MGQLIKLYEYISRYEIDIYKYPSRFIRLKRLQWDNLYVAWKSGSLLADADLDQIALETEPLTKKEKFVGKMKHLFSRKNGAEETPIEEESVPASALDELNFESLAKYKYTENEDELKKQFLDDIFDVQMIWASSTLTHRSYIDSSFYRDDNLKYFIQRFPDTYLVLYKPIFLLKKAPIECETILITPTGAYIMSFLEEEDKAVFIGSDERFWIKKWKEETTKFLNPIISLNRTETVVNQLFKMNDVELPLSKVIISRNGFIDYQTPPYGLKIVDRENYAEWFEAMRKVNSPLKHFQLKAAKSLLDFCKSEFVSRTE